MLTPEGRKKEEKKKASGKGVCTLDAEKDPAELGRPYVYPGSLFAVGKCFMLKDLLTNFTCNEGKNRCLQIFCLFVANMIYLSKLSNKLLSMSC